jgi:tRNA(fMet)-specific endonuclease VapC
MYLLDTNILSEMIKRQPNSHVMSRLSSKPANALFTSSICIMELRFGSSLREDFEKFWQKIAYEIISKVNIIPIGEKEALRAGDILADLRKSGQTIGLEDVLIAASAIVNRHTMVTANVRHFSRIRGLEVENWLAKE